MKYIPMQNKSVAYVMKSSSIKQKWRKQQKQIKRNLSNSIISNGLLF